MEKKKKIRLPYRGRKLGIHNARLRRKRYKWIPRGINCRSTIKAAREKKNDVIKEEYPGQRDGGARQLEAAFKEDLVFLGISRNISRWWDHRTRRRLSIITIITFDIKVNVV